MTKTTIDISTKRVIEYHWQQAWRFKGIVIANFIVAPLTIILERYLAPLVIAVVLVGIQNDTITLQNSIWLIGTYAGLQILGQVVGIRVSVYLMWGVQVLGGSRIYQETYDNLSQHSLGFFGDNFTGSIVSKANKFPNAFMQFWNMVISNLLTIVTSVIATLVGAAIIFWPFAIVLAILLTIFCVSVYYGTRYMRPRQKARSKAYTKISAQLSDSISNILAVKTDSREKDESRRLKQAIGDMVEKEFHVRSGIMRNSTVYSSIIVLARASALLASVWAVQYSSVNAGAVYLLLTYTFNLLQEIWNINGIFRTFYQVTGDSEEMLEILDRPVDIADSSRRKLKTAGGNIKLSDVTFHYDKADGLFNNLSLDIPAGQRVGVVGSSGSGKTTLTKMIMRFIEPESGSINIDGHNIASVSQASLHDAIAYVPQEPMLFHRSIAENISYAKPNATIAQIRKAAKQANALDFIDKLPDGLDTMVGERGVKLSGGQRQRIAIARALLKNAPILVLDEATSALDSESEKLIQDALQKLMKGRTSIVVAHRLSTIAKLDRIIVLDKGQIVEDGPHAELVKQDGTYAKLWSHQSGGFIED